MGLLEEYAASIMMVKERKVPKASSPGGSSNGKTWGPPEVAMFKAIADRHEAEAKGVTRLNIGSSTDHIANIFYRNHWRGAIPEECWEYLKAKIDYWKDRIPDEDEMWTTRNLNDLWVRYRIARRRAAYWHRRSKTMTRVRQQDL